MKPKTMHYFGRGSVTPNLLGTLCGRLVPKDQVTTKKQRGMCKVCLGVIKAYR